MEEVAQPIRFQGQYHDAETGLHYNRFRYYAPDEGCYVHQDPIRLAGGINGSSYVAMPTREIDPFGLCAVNDSSKPGFYVGSDGTTMPSTAYRYMDSSYAAQTQATGEAPLSYFGFTKFETGAEARDAFQVYYQQGDPASWSDARLRGEFNTLQLFNADGSVNARVPLMNGDKGPGLEPFTSAYPQYGAGGEQQLVPVVKPTIVDFSNISLLPDK